MAGKGAGQGAFTEIWRGEINTKRGKLVEIFEVMTTLGVIFISLPPNRGQTGKEKVKLYQKRPEREEKGEREGRTSPQEKK